MNYDLTFQLANSFALISWLILLVFPYASWSPKWVTGLSITLLSVLYAFLALTGFDAESLSDFGSLQGVMDLFTQPQAVLAGWVHYLAFDLMVGVYIVTRSKALGLNRWLLVPILLFTFMLGPVGLLLFFVYRLIKTKNHLSY